MPYICLKCLYEPGSHSFHKLKETSEGVSVFYTCPAKAKYYNDYDGIMAHYDGMLNDNADKPWIWIFDSNGFSLEHAINIKLAKDLALLINNKYSKNLKKIIIVNPTWHINISLKVVLPFLDKRVSDLIFKSNKQFDI
jgi:hypothetical protein